MFSDIIQAVDYMVNLKARKGLNIVAVNCSFRRHLLQPGPVRFLHARRPGGILAVASAGNSSTNLDVSPQYPAAFDTAASAGYDAIIAVAAIQSDGALASYSNYGLNRTDLAAPGSGVLSTVPYATPTVSAGGDSYLAGQITYAASRNGYRPNWWMAERPCLDADCGTWCWWSVARDSF